MKHLLKLALGAVIAIAAPLAHADTIGTIGFTGSDTVSGTTITFSNSSVQTGAPGTGIFSAFTSASTVTFNQLNYATAGSGFILMTATAPTGQVLTFTLNAPVTASSQTFGGQTAIFVGGTGTYTITGSNGSVSTGTFIINTSGTAGGAFTFQDTAIAATPEPNSLMLLGTGLMGAAGMVVRRRRAVVA